MGPNKNPNKNIGCLSDVFSEETPIAPKLIQKNSCQNAKANAEYAEESPPCYRPAIVMDSYNIGAVYGIFFCKAFINHKCVDKEQGSKNNAQKANGDQEQQNPGIIIFLGNYNFSIKKLKFLIYSMCILLLRPFEK